VIDQAVTDKQVSDYSAVLETDLATVFRAVRAEVIEAIKGDNPLEALEKIFGEWEEETAVIERGIDEANNQAAMPKV
jgi:hypothetical protein